MSATESTSNQPAAQDPPAFATYEAQATDLLSSFSDTARRATAFLADWPTNSGYLAYILLSQVAGVAATFPTTGSVADLQRAVNAMVEKVQSMQREMSAEPTANEHEHEHEHEPEREPEDELEREPEHEPEHGPEPELETIPEPVVNVEDTPEVSSATPDETPDPSVTNATPLSPSEELEMSHVELSLIAPTSSPDVLPVSLPVSVAHDDDGEQVPGTGNATSPRNHGNTKAEGASGRGQARGPSPLNAEEAAPGAQTHPKGRRQLYLKSRREPSKGKSASPTPPPAGGTVSQQAEPELRVAFPSFATADPSPSNSIQASEVQAVKVHESIPNASSQSSNNNGPSSSILASGQSPLRSVEPQIQTSATTSADNNAESTGKELLHHNAKSDTGKISSGTPDSGAAVNSSSAADVPASDNSATRTRLFAPLPPLPPRFVRRPLRREGAMIFERPRTQSCPTVPLARRNTMVLSRNGNAGAGSGGINSNSRVNPREMPGVSGAAESKKKEAKKESGRINTEGEEGTGDKNDSDGVAQKKGDTSNGKEKEVVREEEKMNENPKPKTQGKEGSKASVKEETDETRDEPKPTRKGKGKAKATRQEKVREEGEEVVKEVKPKPSTSRGTNSRKRSREVELVNGEEKKDEDERPTRRLRSSTRKQRV
ncbi:hypothetical protein AX16_006111 [Volvariella volvacea WC 439]|nr:hypothetical protein AX16_006111 [Volvariella volvacea WC 439]